jgi:TadE-like protein
MSGRLSFVRDERGATAAEFAMLLPIALLFLLGLIDVGRYAWSVNQAEKATQTGARWAVATDMIPQGLYDYSFAVDGGIPQGTTVDDSVFGGISCEQSGGSVACTCIVSGACDPAWEAVDAEGIDAFALLVDRMRRIYPPIAPANVVVDYKYSGLGFSGDPNGSDVSPLVTVRLRNMSHPMMFMLGQRVSMPNLSYAQTLEDGEGTDSN